jgi:hypothetical protein
MAGGAGNGLQAGYEYHVFLSYRRVPDWKKVVDIIHGHLERRLQTMLGMEIPKVRVFKDDRDVEYGEEWPPELARALSSSMVFVPVLWPEYFAPHKHWCRTELSHMLTRREQLRGPDGIAPALIYPVKIVNFKPPPIADIQAFDVSDLPVSSLMTPRSPKSQQLEKRLYPFVETMLTAIRNPPSYDPSWFRMAADEFADVFSLEARIQHDRPDLGDA